LRDRDTMAQERVSVEKLHSIIAEKVNIAKYLS
jgi:glycyl-tRNA synthetase (class II)